MAPAHRINRLSITYLLVKLIAHNQHMAAAWKGVLAIHGAVAEKHT